MKIETFEEALEIIQTLGDGVDNDWEKRLIAQAIEILEASQEKVTDSDVWLAISSCYNSGDSRCIENSPAKEFQYLERAVNTGHDYAAYWLGGHYQWGDEVNQSFSKALDLYKTLAERGHPEDAQHEIIDMCVDIKALTSCFESGKKPEESGMKNAVLYENFIYTPEKAVEMRKVLQEAQIYLIELAPKVIAAAAAEETRLQNLDQLNCG